jgi:hypothetical protein
MNKAILGLAALLFVSGSTPVFANTKNKRDGFIFGAGVGVSWLTWNQRIENVFPEPISYRANAFPLNTDIRIGVGFNKNTAMLYYWNKLNWLLVEDVDGNALTWNGINGVGLSYYFKPKAPSMYVNGGFGLSFWRVSPFFGDEWGQGGGVVIGVGYEIERHHNLEVALLTRLMMKTVNFMLLAALLMALSCVIRGPYPKPDCGVFVTNGGFYSMDVSVVNLVTDEVERKEVGVGQTETWEIFELSGISSCSLIDEDEVRVQASYTDSSLTNGGSFEKGYDMDDVKVKRITIADCPGWQ